MIRAFRGGRPAAAALIATTAVLLAGCGGGEQAAAGAAGRPAEFTIDFVLDQTGVAQTFTGAVRQGWDLRIDEANANGDVEGVTLATRMHDSQSDPRVGAGVMTEVAGSDAPIAVFGTGSNVAPAVAPIAQRAGLPLVTIYSGSPGVVDAGDQIFRVTAPQATYHQIQSTYFKEQGVKRVAIIYNSDNGTLKNLAESFYPEAAQRDGYEIVSSSGVSVQATDLSAEMTGVLASQPDAVLMLVLSQQNTSVVTQLRRADFPGIIAAQPGIGTQALEALGAEADGVVYPIDFSPATASETGKAFVDAYTARFGDAPDTFAASGYDGASMVIEALNTATSFDRETLHQALLDVSTAGFDGAAGPVRFEERDARVDGVMVRWEGGQETLLTS
ncbi:ABC transporter substrate-binding protein [Pseudonocardia petroleophila]|uniref:ABC transporter substrate-binding protein n=1 Tax=Pseudonocardia petroleophila TaxID=37331 RepID=A0A7G7MBK3_9PSEU|nr:ABC transporter substrate-binding protein [Pseudonocardia petroleophila]QNG50164.1 ABC transporter substrate-binding protein [Pseudonocardia petroleophila]